MKNLLHLLLITSPYLLLTSCASTQLDVMKKITVGMNKATVLDVVGDPDKTFRKDSKDYWTYKYYENNEQKEGQVILENGLVTYIYLNESAPHKDRKEPNSYKEYKKSVKEQRKSYEKQFKNLDD